MAAYETNTLIESALLLAQDPIALIELGLLMLTATYLGKLSLQGSESAQQQELFGPSDSQFFHSQSKSSSRSSLRKRSVSQLRNHFFNVGSLISLPSRSLYRQTC
jgi:hypothetical protein